MALNYTPAPNYDSAPINYTPAPKKTTTPINYTPVPTGPSGPVSVAPAPSIYNQYSGSGSRSGGGSSGGNSAPINYTPVPTTNSGPVSVAPAPPIQASTKNTVSPQTQAQNEALQAVVQQTSGLATLNPIQSTKQGVLYSTTNVPRLLDRPATMQEYISSKRYQQEQSLGKSSIFGVPNPLARLDLAYMQYIDKRQEEGTYNPLLPTDLLGAAQIGKEAIGYYTNKGVNSITNPTGKAVANTANIAYNAAADTITSPSTLALFGVSEGLGAYARSQGVASKAVEKSATTLYNYDKLDLGIGGVQGDALLKAVNPTVSYEPVLAGATKSGVLAYRISDIGGKAFLGTYGIAKTSQLLSTPNTPQGAQQFFGSTIGEGAALYGLSKSAEYASGLATPKPTAYNVVDKVVYEGTGSRVPLEFDPRSYIPDFQNGKLTLKYDSFAKDSVDSSQTKFSQGVTTKTYNPISAQKEFTVNDITNAGPKDSNIIVVDKFSKDTGFSIKGGTRSYTKTTYEGAKATSNPAVGDASYDVSIVSKPRVTGRTTNVDAAGKTDLFGSAFNKYYYDFYKVEGKDTTTSTQGKLADKANVGPGFDLKQIYKQEEIAKSIEQSKPTDIQSIDVTQSVVHAPLQSVTAITGVGRGQTSNLQQSSSSILKSSSKVSSPAVVKPSVDTSLISTPTTKIGGGQVQIQRQSTITNQKITTPTVVIPGVTNGIVKKGIESPPPAPGLKFSIPPVIGGVGSGIWNKLVKTGKKVNTYKPSFTAGALDITTKKKQSNVTTGLDIRPVVTSKKKKLFAIKGLKI